MTKGAEFMIATGYNGYRKMIVTTTQNKEEILLLLYEKALVSLKLARRGIEENNPQQKGENISRALAILTEFDCALDREIGGEMIENLAALYRYASDRLTQANIQNDLHAIKEVEEILSALYDGFKDAAQQATTPAYPNNNAPEMTGGMRIAV
jgi:flagellar secretion chaperone FliS